MEGLAKLLFNAYGEHCGWKAWDGRAMPRWSLDDVPADAPAEARDVGDLVRSHWEAAAAAVHAQVLAEVQGLYLEVKQGTLPDTREGTTWTLGVDGTDMVLCALSELQLRLGGDDLEVPKLNIAGTASIAPQNERLQLDEWRMLHDLLARARHQLVADTPALDPKATATMTQLARTCDFLAKVALLTFVRGGTSGGGGAGGGG